MLTTPSRRGPGLMSGPGMLITASAVLVGCSHGPAQRRTPAAARPTTTVTTGAPAPPPRVSPTASTTAPPTTQAPSTTVRSTPPAPSPTAPTKAGSPPLPPPNGSTQLAVSPSSGPAGTAVVLRATACGAPGSGYAGFFADSRALAQPNDVALRHPVTMSPAGPGAATGTYHVTASDSPGYGVFEVQCAGSTNATAGFTVTR